MGDGEADKTRRVCVYRRLMGVMVRLTRQEVSVRVCEG